MEWDGQFHTCQEGSGQRGEQISGSHIGQLGSLEAHSPLPDSGCAVT